METNHLSRRRRRTLAARLLATVCILTSAGLAPVSVNADEGWSAPRAAGERKFDLPAAGPVSRGFDPPEQRWRAGHRGVDLAVDEGAQVRAAGSGTVVFAGTVVDRPVISIDHPVGIRTTYEPVEPAVSPGARVQRGDLIGVVHPGNGHCASPCLHWGARLGPDEYIDPLRLLGPLVMRLYPPEPW